MRKTIGVLAHVDAGKTTFSECLLYHTKSIKEKGRVDHKSSFMDDHRIERARGITVFSGYGSMEYGDDTYYLVDTPGHTDFSAEMERSIMVMDYAIIIVSAVEGIQGHTETVWNLLRKHKVPTFFFVNKIDRTGADQDGVIQEIKRTFSEDALDITNLAPGKMQEEIIEHIAERDEELLERYLEGNFKEQLWDKQFSRMIKEGICFPIGCGSALEDLGVGELFENIHRYTYTDYSSKYDFTGRIFRIRHREDGSKVTYIKALSGTINTRDEIEYGNGENKRSHKVTGMLMENGGKVSKIDSAYAGDVFGVIGLSDSQCGDVIGSVEYVNDFEIVPLLKSKVVALDNTIDKELYAIFNMLGQEDPALGVSWSEEFQEVHINIMGKIQLEILKDMVKERFNVEIEFKNPEIIYKETIETEVEGFGHFEPLGHYAEVHLKLESAERNTGLSFENKCHTDYLSTGHMNLIEHHLFEREHRGVLTGSGLTDMKVTLISGRSHNKHTSGGDFREATFRAIRQGLEKVENVLLEPFYHFKMRINIDSMGKVLSQIQKASGTFQPPINEGDDVMIEGRVPVYTFMDYPQEFLATTGGRGVLSLKFAGYDRCHNPQDIIEERGYDRRVDKIYSSTSIFCAKGQSYLVTWDEAESEMHCLK